MGGRGGAEEPPCDSEVEEPDPTSTLPVGYPPGPPVSGSFRSADLGFEWGVCSVVDVTGLKGSERVGLPIGSIHTQVRMNGG